MHRLARAAALAASTAGLGAGTAGAFTIDTDSDVKARLDLTPKLSLMQRLKERNPALVRFDPTVDPGRVNEDDGANNFGRGLVSQRADLLAELDVSASNWGLRVSGTAWYDRAYLRRNDYAGTPVYVAGNLTPGVINTANNLPGQARDEFLPATRRQHGRGSELLDAFVTMKGDIGGMRANVRLGKHTLQWGESLFFGQNGIANAQGPVDIAKIVSVPNWQFKEVLLPVEQVSGSLRVAEGVQLGAYYQFKWRKSKLPGVGSYFSNQDYIGAGRVNFGPVVGDLPVLTDRDNKPRDSGQYGVQLRISPTGGDFEYGVYFANYHDKTPSGLVFDFVRGHVRVAYASDIRVFGASVTTSVGQLNLALEGSVRQNTPLNSDPAAVGAAPFAPTFCDTSKATPCYAVGDTAHLQLSGIYVLQPSALWGGGAALFELAYNQRLKVKRDIFAAPNGSNQGVGGLAKDTTKDAWALRVIFEPSYFQVMQGVDLFVPVSVGYNFGGKSSAVGNFAGGVSDGGDYSIGMRLKWASGWTAALAYNDYFGKAKTFTEPLVAGTASPRRLTYGQTLKDRTNVTFSLSNTF
ncbi:DUF1302 domain-containing protein [Rubrivivax rivuli]|uniref:DUF1302 domain-containing protein n=1 Tax=Rubrivivax rivuli TaxID=1862385 RepID=A0A437RFV8_9BURK|nr:DUF1302 domain-containing protein [Rubrivivax rivuli]